MKEVIVASENPVKLNAASIGFAKIFPSEKFKFSPVSVPSGVSSQPKDEADALKGALNRVKKIQKLYPKRCIAF